MGGRGSTLQTRPYANNSLDELKELRKDLMARVKQDFGNVTELSESDARRFNELMQERDAIEYELFTRMSPAVKQENLDKRNSERGAQTDLNSEEIAIARTDMLKNRDIYMAIQSASHGIGVVGNRTVNTAVDTLYEQNPDRFYKAFANTRRMLREKYGDTITLYRSPTGQTPKATVNMTSLRSNAAQYGARVISVRVPVDDVLAVNIARNGGYEEFIVLNRRRQRY